MIKPVLEGEIYVSDAEHAQNPELMKELGIKSVMALGVSFADYEQMLDCDYKFFHVDDDVIEQLPWQAAQEWLEEAEKPVLVHCDLGMSRSPAICIYYLMKTRHMMYDEALAHMQGVTQVKINAGFRRQLYVWELDVVVYNKGYFRALWWVGSRVIRKLYEWCV